MTIVLFAVPRKAHPDTIEWANTHNAEIEEVPEHDLYAYHRALRRRWAEEKDLLVLEHDIVPAQGVTEEMLACRRPWCVSPYRVGNGDLLTEGLGCTKFSAALLATEPHVMRDAGLVDTDGGAAGIWQRMDIRVNRILRVRGHVPHVHAESAHLHDYSGG